MKKALDETKPIYVQIKEHIEDSIIGGTLNPDERAPSTNEFAAFYKINPATAAKGINELVAEDILVKRRGIGMFVTAHAKSVIIEKRKKTFYDHYILPLKQEAEKLEINEAELIEWVKGERKRDEN
ncbi:putative HTH-type transcriptional regulator YhcF [Lentibacillus sp. JNUCC-1]|uniref:GntR family transcriptional regulator n=1 Tax=Lentibacillus sp. JNUCC-1 TaxID=2654513 RepID=UPI0012E756F6|nr:GntR family transcriptional regulator [Lentibacillus sp. JNUCC-1]MUV38694.1 putative HTH-type transcriptional regulator YhcF [Lentibacillus sp. JNUCC-1]